MTDAFQRRKLKTVQVESSFLHSHARTHVKIMDVVVHVGLNARGGRPIVLKNLTPLTTMAELHARACEAHRLPREEYRTHFKGKVYDDAEIIGSVLPSRGGKVALMHDPERARAARREAEAEVARVRAMRRDRYYSSSAVEETTPQRANDYGRGEFQRTPVMTTTTTTPVGASPMFTSPLNGSGGRAAPAATSTPLERALERVEATASSASKYDEELNILEKFGSADDATRKRLLFLGDAFERALLALDGIESHGSTEVRERRKAAVNAFNALAERVDALKRACAE